MNNEYCLLGIVLNNPELFQDLEKCGNIFQNNNAHKLYAILENMKTFTKESILDFIQDDKHFNISLFDEIYESEYNPKKFQFYLDKVLTSHTKVKLLEYLNSLRKNEYKTIKELKNDIKDFQENIKDFSVIDIKDCKEDCKKIIEDMQEDKEIKTVYSAIDFFEKYQLGFDYGDMIYLAAGESVGKTAFMINNIAKQLKRGLRIGVFSSEMGKRKIIELVTCNIAAVDNLKLKTKSMTKDEQERFIRAIEKVYEYPLFVSDSLMLDDIKRESYIMKKEKNVQMIYIDYLQIIKTVKYMIEYERIGLVSSELTKTAKNLNIPFFVLAAITKEAKERDLPYNSDIRGNGLVNNDADIILHIRELQNAVDGNANMRLLKFWVGKNRNGRKGDFQQYFYPAIRSFINTQY